MFITQISIFLENVKGTLCKVTTLLSNHDIDLLALTIADTSGFGIVRIIVNGKDVDTCLAILQEAGYSARKNKVICVKVPDQPGGLNRVLTLLQEAQIGIEYLYSMNYNLNGQALLVLRLTDRDAGIKVLTDHQVEIASQEEINTLN